MIPDSPEPNSSLKPLEDTNYLLYKTHSHLRTGAKKLEIRHLTKRKKIVINKLRSSEIEEDEY